MKRIIAFAGRKRSGKTLLAKFLRNEYGAVIITIADYLKHLCCNILNINYETLIEWKDNGHLLNVLPDEHWFKIISKETGIPYNIVEQELVTKMIHDIREMLQVVGTDVIRKYNADWHVTKMIEGIESFKKEQIIVIDDVRFPNERKAIESFGGEVFFIINSFNNDVSNHESEKSLLWRDFDAAHVILNTKIGKDEFITNFKLHYENDFKQNIPNSIFLYENMNYVSELINTKNPLIKEDCKFFYK